MEDNKKVGNSHKIKEANGGVVEHKHNIREKKQGSGFTDKAESFMEPIVNDIIIPGAQDMVIDIADGILNNIYNGIVSAITGQPSDRRLSIRQHRNRDGRTNYSRKLSDNKAVRNERSSGGIRETSKLESLRVDTHSDAVNVVEQLIQICESYGKVTVNELYSLDEINKSCPYTYNDFGWTNLNEDNCSILSNSDGTWSFDLPRPKPLT